MRTANRHIKHIRYGNRVSHLIQPDLTMAKWLFEVVFDYGEGHYAEDAADPDGNIFASVSAAVPPGGAWAVRDDPFSSRRAGFENRTYRLCRRVLMIHHFDELAADSARTTSCAQPSSGTSPRRVATSRAPSYSPVPVWHANENRIPQAFSPVRWSFEFSGRAERKNWPLRPFSTLRRKAWRIFRSG